MIAKPSEWLSRTTPRLFKTSKTISEKVDVMRRKEFEMCAADAQSLLRNGEYGVLSTVDEKGVPYGVPLNYAYDGEKIYFHCAPNAGRKLANISRNNKVCFTVAGRVERVPEKFSTRYESVVAEGVAEPASDKKYALKLLIEKYAAEYSEKGAEYIERSSEKTAVYEINITEFHGKSRFL